MVVTVQDVALKVWHQNVSADYDREPDTEIPSGNIRTVSIDERAENVNDEVSLTVDTPQPGEYDLRMGDRVQFEAEISSGLEVEWTGRIKSTDYSRGTAGNVDATLEADATDFVGAILSDRQITGSWVGEDVGQIIRDIVTQKASELDASEVPDLDEETDQFWQQKNCWDAVVGLAAKADCLLYQSGRSLYVEPIGELPFQFELEYSDYSLPWDTQTLDEPKNVVRVDSGESRQLEESQEDQDSYQRVTEDSRLTHRLRARKSEIHSIELYVRRVSDEDLSVRLQADEDGEPVEIDNTDSDIESTSWDADNLPSDGWQAFFLPAHTLPDRDPWLIIQSDGDEGHDVAVNTDGAPAFRSYYPHPLAYEVSSNDSIDEYGPREIAIERDNLETISSVQDAAQSELARRGWPNKTIEFPARSPRAHALEPGDIIDVDNPSEDAEGEFIVIEVSREFDATDVKLETHITAKWRRGILDPDQ
jgi:hypothetical protein